MPAELASAALAFVPVKATHYWCKKVTLPIERLVDLKKKLTGYVLFCLLELKRAG